MQSSKDVQATMDMLTALRSPETRRVLLWVLQKSNLLYSSYVQGDALATARNEGLRAVGILLMEYINKADPEAFARLLIERRKEA